MNATTSAALILAVMVAAYVLAKILKLSTELSLFAAALAGALAGGDGIPARHIVEGAFTYLDIVLIFVTATLFMNLLKESGGVAFAVRPVLRRFHRRKAPPRPAGRRDAHPRHADRRRQRDRPDRRRHGRHVLGYMGIPKPKVAAIVFVIAGLSAAAPPVTLWAMLTAAGVNMPYVGFFLPLLVPCLLLALATIFILGWKAKPADLDQALQELPEAPPRHELAQDRAAVPRLLRPPRRRPHLAVRLPDPRPAAHVRRGRGRHAPPLAGPYQFPRSPGTRSTSSCPSSGR